MAEKPNLYQVVRQRVNNAIAAELDLIQYEMGLACWVKIGDITLATAPGSPEDDQSFLRACGIEPCEVGR